MADVVIELPPSESSYYRFGDLPGLMAQSIASAQVPDVPDRILNVIAWCNIKGHRWRYVKLTPPLGTVCTDFSTAAKWVREEVKGYPHGLRQNRRELLARHKAGQIEELPRLPTGELVIDVDREDRALKRAFIAIKKEEAYRQLLGQAAVRPEATSGYLHVVDSDLDPLTFRAGDALQRGLVHIDWLNEWGATQRPMHTFTAIQPAVKPARRGIRHALTPEQKRVIAARYRGGQTVRSLAAEFQVARRTIDRALLDLEIKKNKRR